jgi:hypothetical protein
MMANDLRLDLSPNLAGGGKTEALESHGWRLYLPAGGEHQYRLAQIDDYLDKPRSQFLWRPPVAFELNVRVSDEHNPGTWGFGWWNDPFSLSFGFGGGQRRFPAYPNAAWFFYASPPNYLSFRDDLPAQGFLTATFRSPIMPRIFRAFAGGLLPLSMWRVTAPLFRHFVQKIVGEDSKRLNIDVTQWHHYEIQWEARCVRFFVDEQLTFSTQCTPQSPLGLALWIDNQYAAFPPGGTVKYGLLSNPERAWLECKGLKVRVLDNPASTV